MVTHAEFLAAIGNPTTEEAAQVAVGTWLAKQIGHTPKSITYRCLGHNKGFAYCAYADGTTLLGMTFANIEDGEAVIAPVQKEANNADRIRRVIEAMQLFAGNDQFELAAMCRDLVGMLGVDPLTYEAR